MSEIENNVQENTGTEQTVENETAATGSTSILNLAVESVMDLIDALNLYAKIIHDFLIIYKCHYFY